MGKNGKNGILKKTSTCCCSCILGFLGGGVWGDPVGMESDDDDENEAPGNFHCDLMQK